MTKEELSEYFRQMGKKGGDRRAATLSKARIIEIARTAGKAKRKRTKP